MNKIANFFENWTDLCDVIAGRPVDYVESFWLLVVALPLVVAITATLLQTLRRRTALVWKKSQRARVFIGMAIFVAIWPGFVVCGAIYYALGKLFSEKRTSFKRTLHKGMDTYIRFFERGTLKKKQRSF